MAVSLVVPTTPVPNHAFRGGADQAFRDAARSTIFEAGTAEEATIMQV